MHSGKPVFANAVVEVLLQVKEQAGVLVPLHFDFGKTRRFRDVCLHVASVSHLELVDFCRR